MKDRGITKLKSGKTGFQNQHVRSKSGSELLVLAASLSGFPLPGPPGAGLALAEADRISRIDPDPDTDFDFDFDSAPSGLPAFPEFWTPQPTFTSADAPLSADLRDLPPLYPSSVFRLPSSLFRDRQAPAWLLLKPTGFQKSISIPIPISILPPQGVPAFPEFWTPHPTLTSADAPLSADLRG